MKAPRFVPHFRYTVPFDSAAQMELSEATQNDAMVENSDNSTRVIDSPQAMSSPERVPITGFRRFTTVSVNPLNLKCETLPIFSLNNPYSRNFHLSWLGFFVAFLSWFSFSPLIPEAIKTDLKLTNAQVGNSNIASLCATLGIRVVVGPLVDRYGPRKVMAWILIVGAVPSGLAGTATDARGLYIIRFFIGILGGTFVPCQAWTTTFYDKSIVGRANAFSGGWGNAGGGFTFIIMIALYDKLLSDGLSSHASWRVALAIVPVPVMLFTAAIILIFGTDHPAGKWSQRHNIPVGHLIAARDTSSANDADKDTRCKKADGDVEKEGVGVSIQPVLLEKDGYRITSELDAAVNEPLTLRVAAKVVSSPLTWLPSLAYLTTFGYELAIDANVANVLFAVFKSPSFGQTKAGYIAALYGLLNIFTRPLGGYMGDLVYPRFGVPGKKYLTIACGFLQGCMSLALGLYIDSTPHPSLAVVIVVFVIMAIFNEAANGANFSLVPHCHPNSNGLISGIVGAAGNLGGVIFAIIFRFQPVPSGKAFWISGSIVIAMNSMLMFINVPRQ